MVIQNLKQFGIGSAFFMFVLLATGMAKAVTTPTTLVASVESSSASAIELVSAN